VNAVSVNGLAKAYGATPVLDGLELEVPAGRFVAVLGASGCGKSTLLRVLAGFESADRGVVRIGDAVVDDGVRRTAASRRRVGHVPQEGALFPHLDVHANVAFGLPRGERRRGGPRVAELIDSLGLAGLERRRPHELSGGQQQRVALARALAPRPTVVLLDEPFSALDPDLRDKTRTDIRAALAELGTTTILVTHDQDEALSLADHVALLRDGRIAQAGTPQELYRTPADVETARFLGDANLLPTADGLMLVRPEDLRLSPPNGAAWRTAVVTAVEYFGHDARVQLRCEDPSNAPALIARTVGGDTPGVGQRVSLSLPSAAHLVPDPAARSGGANITSASAASAVTAPNRNAARGP
jgi:iron(III) transport system ATP-binding protein